MTDKIKPDWIAVDWGTSNLRAFAMQGAQVLDRVQSDQGMGQLQQEEFEPVLGALIAPWQAGNLPIVACGMVGARQGWVEAPYRQIPCTPLADHLTLAHGKTLNAHVVPGLKQTKPADVMRGEETQIAGFLALNEGWDGVICLPGTHTKWAHVSAGEVVSFQSFMTGELFELLSRQSVLRHSIGCDGWDEETFTDAVSDAMAKPERLAARLFGLRAADLLQGTSLSENRAQLSGLLIGAELAAARPYWLGQNIAILGSGALARAYLDALRTQGVPATLADTQRMTIAGLTAAYRILKADI